MFELGWKNKKDWRRFSSEVALPAQPSDKKVLLSSLLLWEEHCVECSAPQCYGSCRLYADRGDGRCRRFSYGIYPNSKFSGLFNYGADIRFKRWAKLEAVWPQKPMLYPVRKVRRLAALLDFYEFVLCTVLRLLPVNTKLFRRVQYELIRGRQVAFKAFGRLAGSIENPDALYIKVFSPEALPCNLQLELVQGAPVYRTNLSIVQGWNEFTLSAEKFQFRLGTDQFLRLWVDHDQEVRLIFTWLELVKFESKASATKKVSAEKVKCVAWDLDNTLWKGVIGDDGKEGVQPSPEALELIEKLDQRGILQTVVSKNEHERAWEKIVELKLENYFLYPAINWDPKSVNLSRIAAELNIGIDTFAMIDDSRFEREEVAHVYPEVRTYDPTSMSTLLGRKEFDVPVTGETGTRRLKYLEDLRRKSARQNWQGELDGFLRDCDIELEIGGVRHLEQSERCLELLQRSNQFNLSGKRYSAQEFEALLRNNDHASYVLRVRDRYGDYGIVGFVSVQNSNNAVVVSDFVMSCRVARKKIENAFFYAYLSRTQCTGKEIYARMKVTGRNQPLRQVFDELGFEVVSQKDSEMMMQVDPTKLGGTEPPIAIKWMD